MIKITNNSNNCIFVIFIFIVSSILSMIQVYNLVLSNGITFGYNETLEWKILLSIFWSVVVFGSIAYIYGKKVSFVMLMPTSLIILVCILVSVKYVLYRGIEEKVLYLSGFLLSSLILVLINLKSSRRRLNISYKEYLYGVAVLVLFSYLFFALNRYYV